ncbi:MAG: NAD(P)H-dependent oxidoreductase subunit E, partial [Bacilli bacterium]|nr:NAD(P)H-dependent oxidoreductase subunit E [Bacilli bacterium]
RAQDIFGYLPMVVQTHIARKLNINVSKVYGVVSFYSFFSMKPKGENVIAICLGTACFVRGSGKILERVEELLGIKNGETTPDGKFTITTLRCVGACGLAPVMQINDKTYGNITPEDVESILANY